MSRKILAIGGGDNGRLDSDGIKHPYELGPQDKEIIRLTGKEHPNFLLIAHSQPLERQEGYFQVMVDIFEKMYGCPCKDLKSDKLTDIEYVQKLIDWADIIYEGGGNTLDMIKLWQDTGFDKVLRKAWESGKVMCGVSAGANCWFKECSSDSLQIKYWKDQPLIRMTCLWLADWLFVPHCDEEGRQEHVKQLLKNESDETWLLFSNCAALEIIDDEYRVLTSDASNYDIKEAYWKKTYRKNGEYVEEILDNTPEFKKLSELYSKL